MCFRNAVLLGNVATNEIVISDAHMRSRDCSFKRTSFELSDCYRVLTDSLVGKRKLFIAFVYTCHESRYFYIQVILTIMLFLIELAWDEAAKTSDQYASQDSDGVKHHLISHGLACVQRRWRPASWWIGTPPTNNYGSPEDPWLDGPNKSRKGFKEEWLFACCW